MKNCKNCGAPLHGCKCEYCGTEYTKSGNEIFKCGTNNTMNELFSDGKFYIEEIVREPIIVTPFRNEKGLLCRPKMLYKTTVKMVEV